MSARIQEIRSENEDGDVAGADIEWLCRIAEAAERLVRYEKQRGTLVSYARDLQKVLSQRIFWDGASQRWGVR